MHLNIVGFFAVVLAIVAFFCTYRIVKARSRKVRILCLGIFSLLAIPALLFSVYYLHVLPEKAWFYTLRSIRGSEFLVIFLGCAAGVFSMLLPRFLLGFPLFGVLLIGVLPYLKPLLSPLDYAHLQDRWRGVGCLQSTGATCGPASVASALKSLGISVSEREIAEAAFSYSGGTEAWYLARYISSRGFKARFSIQSPQLPNMGYPAIVGVRIGGMGHFIAVLSENDDGLWVADPLVGEERLSQEDFLKRYRCTGFTMTIAEG